VPDPDSTGGVGDVDFIQALREDLSVAGIAS
jgi:hypothetical protein